MDYNFIAAVFLVLAGVYVFYGGFCRMFSDSYFEKIVQKYFGGNPGDVFLERYIRPIGWMVLGTAFVFSGLYILFFK